MQKLLLVLCFSGIIASCKNEKTRTTQPTKKDTITEFTSKDQNSDFLELTEEEPIMLTLKEANRLAKLPLECIGREFPNKPGQTLQKNSDQDTPKNLHPAFYGCFDWHSSVHGHWSLVSLLKNYPDLKQAEQVRSLLKKSLSAENIQAELAYFKRPSEISFERTYGWAWLLKLAEEIKTWEDPLATELDQNLQPLTNYIVNQFSEFLPKLKYPIRVGEHTNTAFSLSFAFDYAVTTDNKEFQNLISKRANSFYLEDDNCPIGWEPSGYDFLSPCLEEIDIMRKTMPKNAFILWIKDFMPDLMNTDYDLEPGIVSDREDGKLVHLDGLNFSRGWVLYGLANQYPDQFGHLKTLANRHISHSFSNVVNDSYEGGHWLATFAIYALNTKK
ncbi:DUF2891 domain-containing protein [Zunongwangia sp.]|uniref:DUF2891 domain-containing protein n=1 Tax=Zunongwangia sp. TaxID=1965325 RepID=UPI003AA84B61